MEPLALWGEPLDILNGGQEFFQGVRSLLLDTCSKEPSQELTALQSEVLKCLVGVATLTGNQDLLL